MLYQTTVSVIVSTYKHLCNLHCRQNCQVKPFTKVVNRLTTKCTGMKGYLLLHIFNMAAKHFRPDSYTAFLPCGMQFKQKIMKQIISLSIVSTAFDMAEMRSMNQTLQYTAICNNLNKIQNKSSVRNKLVSILKPNLFLDFPILHLHNRFNITGKISLITRSVCT